MAEPTLGRKTRENLRWLPLARRAALHVLMFFSDRFERAISPENLVCLPLVTSKGIGS
jgi:hypothetical protein